MQYFIIISKSRQPRTEVEDGCTQKWHRSIAHISVFCIEPTKSLVFYGDLHRSLDLQSERIRREAASTYFSMNQDLNCTKNGWNLQRFSGAESVRTVLSEFRDFFNIHKIYSWGVYTICSRRVDVLTVDEERLAAVRVLQV